MYLMNFTCVECFYRAYIWCKLLCLLLDTLYFIKTSPMVCFTNITPLFIRIKNYDFFVKLKRFSCSSCNLKVARVQECQSLPRIWIALVFPIEKNMEYFRLRFFKTKLYKNMYLFSCFDKTHQKFKMIYVQGVQTQTRQK